MPTKRIRLITGEIYHVVIRGVGDSTIFKDNDDYYRGIFSLYEFNTTTLIEIRERRKQRKAAKAASGGQTPDARDHWVEILEFCLMPNHIHLLLRQLKDKGITKFMQKLGTGYATYFNRKYNRKGHLLGRFYAVHIKDDTQLKTVFVYIHTNSISLVEPKWKELGVKNPQKVIKFIENYKWSSYADYLGKENFPSVTERDFLTKIMGGKEGCRSWVNDWVEYKEELSGWQKVGIE